MQLEDFVKNLMDHANSISIATDGISPTQGTNKMSA